MLLWSGGGNSVNYIIIFLHVCLRAWMYVLWENVGVSVYMYMYVHTFMHACTCMYDRA